MEATLNVEQSIRLPVINRPEYTAYIQSLTSNDTTYVFVHLDVRKWSAGVMRSMLSDFNCFAEMFGFPLYAFNELDDEKHRKFLELMGFEYVTQLTGFDNKTRNVYKLVYRKDPD